MLVRRERPADVPVVRAVVAAAFARAGQPDPPIEVRLLDELRGDESWLPALSLVAVEHRADGGDTDSQGRGGSDGGDGSDSGGGGDVVGHVVCTRAYLDDLPVLGLGPLAVRPDRHGRGVGTALMHAVLGAAEALDEPLVALLGDPAYYQRFGLRPSQPLGVVAPDPRWGRYFQVRVLGTDPPTPGTFRYAEPFNQL
ncbi:N-acetyltransferase [Solwaraspora sp. WMMD406]|uniref:GNAT family N-acetyltransferase n=1 Tax=Solwaraspora sp. WMMD406 TaxID=3016095 RepID=UPI00241604B6|nr:N-acetyltransferase [Solwaraspora sp. WMMD406]MDG4764314.1 N-acetyltransferase [Solwaraspora sp. WMMD406]